jgi:hypothetical protein
VKHVQQLPELVLYGSAHVPEYCEPRPAAQAVGQSGWPLRQPRQSPHVTSET